jgi:hypothetical protein
MSEMWLYQMSEDWYPRGGYRLDIWEGALIAWDTGKVVGGHPEPGDRILCWYSKTVSDEPGVWGWGVIMSSDDESIRWKPVFPLDHLKLAPLFDDDLNDCIDRIRGKMRQGTMWRMSADDAEYLTARVAGCIGRPIP